MTSAEDNIRKTIEDLIYYYEQKKRLSSQHYAYIASEKNDKYFLDAAEYCIKNHISPSSYLDMMYDNFGTKKAFFSPKNLQSSVAEKYLKNKAQTEGEFFNPELNNNNLDYDKIWRQQIELATDYMSFGQKIEDILKDPKLKFFAWFRILATTHRNPEIIHEYIHIAKKELNPRLLAYLKQNSDLDINRLL
jgi:hypothetical protein